MPPSLILIGPADKTTVCADITIKVTNILHSGNREIIIMKWELTNQDGISSSLDS
jgi:hypothetical protein